MKKTVIKRIALTTLTALMIAFIFTQSLLPADESADESSAVMDLVNGLLSSLNLDLAVTDFIIRKTAHFTEFFILGALLYFTIDSYIVSGALTVVIPSVGGLLIAAADECIQSFSEGRSTEIRDMLIDLSGVLCAVALMYLLRRLLNKRKEKREKIE